MYKKVIALFVLVTVLNVYGKSKKNSPPHCTVVSKDTDYVSKFRLDYPVAYVTPGQSEAYQQMYCRNPPTVNKAWASVCDWAAPPQVHFTLGDEYLHVVRQDPHGQYLGNAVIITYQLCSHNTTHLGSDDFVIVQEIEDNDEFNGLNE